MTWCQLHHEWTVTKIAWSTNCNPFTPKNEQGQTGKLTGNFRATRKQSQ